MPDGKQDLARLVAHLVNGIRLWPDHTCLFNRKHQMTNHDKKLIVMTSESLVGLNQGRVGVERVGRHEHFLDGGDQGAGLRHIEFLFTALGKLIEFRNGCDNVANKQVPCQFLVLLGFQLAGLILVV